MGFAHYVSVYDASKIPEEIKSCMIHAGMYKGKIFAIDCDWENSCELYEDINMRGYEIQLESSGVKNNEKKNLLEIEYQRRKTILEAALIDTFVA